jgi:hypothetical protein
MLADYLPVAVVLGVALIVSIATWSQHHVTQSLYAAAIDAMVGPDGVALADHPGIAWTASQEVVHEGIRWARNAHCEATIWAIVLTVILVVSLGWGFWKEGLFGKKMM